MVSKRISDIDKRKLKIEAYAVVEIKKIFNNMAVDVARLYKANGRVSAQEIANNYQAEFLKDIRDVMRKSIKQFGFDLRKELQLKYGLFFNAEFKSHIFDFETKNNISIISNAVKSELENINQEFFKEATFFVANQSEKQVALITDTNIKQISEAIVKEELNYSIGKAYGNKQDWQVIANNVLINLLGNKQSRSQLIASQIVGMTEGWSRFTEANIIDSAEIQTKPAYNIIASKVWFTVLSIETRPWHVAADQQTKRVKEDFYVNGENLKYPRDPNGSIKNIANCRCHAEYILQEVPISKKNMNIILSNTKICTCCKSIKAIKDIDLVPTEQMAREAEKGLKWREEFNRGGTLVGVARANQLKNRERLTPKTIGRMVSYFARHEVDKKAEGFNQGEQGFPSAGRVAWQLWGGDAGKVWANKKWEQIQKEKNN